MNRRSRRASARIPQVNIEATRKHVCEALKAVLYGPFGGNCPPEDLDAFTSLCVMSAMPTGKEDPKDLLRSMSDTFIETVRVNSGSVFASPVAKRVSRFFFMEWCWRHGHLKEDWRWEWKGPAEGDLHYLEAIPLNTMSGFSG